jgi:CheY-like chemotaxis protein
MRTLLERRGYHVVTAATMQGGIDAARAEQFDFLISDIGLPDGTGLEMMQQIRSLGIELRGIALSGFGMEDDVRRSREAGFLDHLTKPVSFQKLQELIERLLAS